MLKYLINLLATGISLVTVLLVANISVAAPVASSFATENFVPLQQVSLNLIGPELERVTASQAEQFPHLGCSCANCTQVAKRANP